MDVNFVCSQELLREIWNRYYSSSLNFAYNGKFSPTQSFEEQMTELKLLFWGALYKDLTPFEVYNGEKIEGKRKRK